MPKKETQLDRIERKLDWIIVEAYNEAIRKLFRKGCPPDEDLEGVLWELPTVSDVFRNRGK